MNLRCEVLMRQGLSCMNSKIWLFLLCQLLFGLVVVCLSRLAIVVFCPLALVALALHLLDSFLRICCLPGGRCSAMYLQLFQFGWPNYQRRWPGSAQRRCHLGASLHRIAHEQTLHRLQEAKRKYRPRIHWYW